MKKKRIVKKVFRPGERVVIKKTYLAAVGKVYRNRVGVVQSPPYLLRSRGRAFLNVAWDDDLFVRWFFPGRYFKRAPKKTLMPDTRAYLETMASLDV